MNNAQKPNPNGNVSKLAGDAIPMHKKMAMGEMPKVGDGPKTPA
jgi:hypothetical protein